MLSPGAAQSSSIFLSQVAHYPLPLAIISENIWAGRDKQSLCPFLSRFTGNEIKAQRGYSNLPKVTKQVEPGLLSISSAFQV